LRTPKRTSALETPCPADGGLPVSCAQSLPDRRDRGNLEGDTRFTGPHAGRDRSAAASRRRLPPGVGLPRPPGGNPLIIVTRDLPESEGLALRALLRVESEAVRADLIQARRERAAAWRALARGEVNEAEAARRLDVARRRELAARSRVEAAVAEWALRQSPEVRARVGEALARDAQPRGRYPVRPDLPAARPPPGPPEAEGES